MLNKHLQATRRRAWNVQAQKKQEERPAPTGQNKEAKS